MAINDESKQKSDKDTVQNWFINDIFFYCLKIRNLSKERSSKPEYTILKSEVKNKFELYWTRKIDIGEFETFILNFFKNESLINFNIERKTNDEKLNGELTDIENSEQLLKIVLAAIKLLEIIIDGDDDGTKNLIIKKLRQKSSKERIYI